VAEHYKTRYKTPTGRRKIASDFSAYRRDGRFPIARSKKNAAKSTLTEENAADDGSARSLNKPRTVPRCRPDLGTERARGSRKVPDGPPDPENERAAPAGSKGGSNRNKAKSRSPRNITLRPGNSQAANASLSVYDGQKWLGRIEQSDREYDAYSVADCFLSSHRTLKEAADAVAASGGGL
jgi:hypothetical protein